MVSAFALMGSSSVEDRARDSPEDMFSERGRRAPSAAGSVKSLGMKRLIVGITGASGAIYGVRLLEQLRELPVETHLIATRWARITIEHETDRSFAEVRALADVSYSEGDQSAAVSSGSFVTDGMIIAPCSMKTVSALATGFAHNLMCRAADVVLKERRPLVLAVRETPLHSIHLRNLATLSDMGVVIAPPVAGVLREADVARRDGRLHGRPPPRSESACRGRLGSLVGARRRTRPKMT